MSALQGYKKQSVISELEPVVLRHGNNDLMLSVRHSRNDCIDMPSSSNFVADNPYKQDLVGTRHTETYDYRAFPGSSRLHGIEEDLLGTKRTLTYDYRVLPGYSRLQSIEDDPESRVLNNSNIFVPEDPGTCSSTDPVADVYMGKHVNNVVDDLYQTINSEEGFYQDEMAAYHAAQITNAGWACQGQPGLSKENNDLQPSHRHAVSQKFEHRITTQCSRQTLHQNLSTNFLNKYDEASGAMSSNYIITNVHPISDVPIHNSNRGSQGQCSVDISLPALPRNQRVSLPLEGSSSVVNGRNCMYLPAVRSDYCIDTNILTQPRDRRVSLPLEHPSIVANGYSNSTFCGVENTVDYNEFVPDAQQPRNRRISLPLECSVTSTVTYRHSIPGNDERVVNGAVNIHKPISGGDSRKNSEGKSDKRPILEHELFSAIICDKSSNGSTSELTRNCNPISDTLDFNDSANVNKPKLCIGKENVSLKSQKQCNKSNMLSDRSTRKHISKKKCLYSKPTHSNKRKGRSKLLLNTPGKSRQLQLIHNIHRKIANSSKMETSELCVDTDSASMLSKLEDIFPLVSVVQKPTRPLRTRAVKDVQTLSRELSTEGIWTSVNSNLLS